MPVSLIILSLALLAIALRKVIHLPLPIWAIMLLGAVTTLLLQQITPTHALASIEPDVMFYLFGVFLISEAAETSGYLEQLTDTLFFHAHTGKQALLIIMFVLGLSAALLMNDTVAIVGTPIILQLCRKHPELTKPLLLALAFAVTIGSTMSPIGNPQNLLIAVKGGMSSPFLDFIKPLAVPTLINLMVAYIFIYVMHRSVLNKTIEKPAPEAITDHRTVQCVKLSLLLLVTLMGVKIITDLIHVPHRLDFGIIALISALPILASQQRWKLIKQLDWGTLIFFASTFILMQSVWDSGFFQANITHFHIPVTHIIVILILSVVLSQFISNVPLVALYLPLLMHHGSSESHVLALAVGSTIAGNISILGAASNVIIVQNVEKRKAPCFGYFEFMKLGIPLTAINLFVYYLFL
jgi:Na+/H+ antiporter NhaD/arsenite permease-like protein